MTRSSSTSATKIIEIFHIWSAGELPQNPTNGGTTMTSPLFSKSPKARVIGTLIFIALAMGWLRAQAHFISGVSEMKRRPPSGARIQRQGVGLRLREQFHYSC